jgi:gamma-glutamyltranspeptidase/glutathione hydrolase
MPPPSSGGIHVAQILNIVEELELNKNQNEFPWDAKNIHYTVSAMQQAFVDRTAHLGDPDFFPIPSKELTSKSYAAAIAETLQIDKFKNPDEVVAYGKQKTSPTKKDSTETTHFSIITEDGYAISSTQTINGGFGSHVVAKNTGVFLNNEIDDFGIKVGASNQFGAIGGEKNLIAPLKRPLSSMSPTIVVKAGRPVLALGSPNGTRIITCVAQTILNYHLYQLTLRDSVYLMRYHHQWRPNELWLEEGAFLQASIKDLKSKGHNLIRQNFPCRIQAVAMENKELIGVSDPRGRGLAQGL